MGGRLSLIPRWFKSLLPYPRPSAIGMGLVQGLQAQGNNFVINIPALDAVNDSQQNDFLSNSAVMACIGWIVDIWPEAPFMVTDKDGTPIEGHRLTEFMRRPSSLYGDIALWMATTISLKLDGNAYWYKVRRGENNTGQIGELEYLPHFLVEPKSNAGGGSYIDYYEYRPGTESLRLDPADVVHFRDGIDPWNVRKGLSRFASLIREVCTDNEAEKFSYAILRNMGVGGYVIQPDIGLFSKDATPAMSADEANKVADTFYRRTTGVNRGRPIVNTIPLKIDRLSWSPNEINMRDVHRIPEERICAVLGVPPGVVGLGAGLDRNTYNNAQTDEEKAYRRAILPMHRIISDALDQHLLPEFDNRAGVKTGFDIRDVSALQEDEDARAIRIALLANSNIITREQAQIELGYQPEQMEGEYLRQDVSLGRVSKSRKSAPTLDEAIEQLRLASLKAEVGMVQELQAAYRVADITLRKDLEALILRMEQAQAAGETLSPAWALAEERYRTLIAAVEKQSALLSARGTTITTNAQRTSIDKTQGALAEIASSVDASWAQLPKDAVAKFVGFASDGGPLGALFAEASKEFARAIPTLIASGLVRGDNPRTIARAFTDAISGASNRAEVIARTEMIRAHREASREAFGLNGMKHWVWHSATDFRTCPACWAMHGKVFDTDEKLDGHPQCRCALVPLFDGINVTPGSELFSSLPQDDQREILGQGGYDLYSSGAASLDDFVTQTTDPVWGSMRRPSTLAEVEANARKR